MFNESRFFEAIEKTPDYPPLVALRYAIWALAATATIEHRALASDLYELARKHAEDLENKVQSTCCPQSHEAKLTEQSEEEKICCPWPLLNAGIS
jgi:hypothetical protein